MAIHERKRRDGARYYAIDFRYGPNLTRRKREYGGESRTEAKRLLTARRAEVNAGTYVNPGDPQPAEEQVTFHDFVNRFEREYTAQRRSTYYKNALKPMREFFGDKPLAEITRADLDLFRAWRARQPGKQPGSSLGPETLRKNLTVLGTVFRMAVRWGVLDASPAVDLDKPGAPKHRVRYLTFDEWERLQVAAPPYLRPLLRMGLAAGLRLKEVTTLRWDHIDRAGGVFYVAQDSKTGQAPVPLTDEARAVLDGQIRHVRNPYVFLDAEGKSYDDDRARNRICKATIAAMRRAGIKDASYHTIRHTAASWMVQRGVPLAEVRDFMRHTSVTMTERYAHLQPQHLGKSVAALNSALRGDGRILDSEAVSTSKAL